MSLRMFSQRLRNIGISSPGMLSATGTRGSFTMPHSMASMSEKSLIVHGNERALGVARAAQEERRRGEVDDAGEAELAVHRLEAGDPEAGGLVVLLGLLPLVALEVVLVGLVGLLAVAVVRLVVEDEDVLHAHQVGHDALDHLAFGLQRVQLLARAALEQRAAALGELDALAQLEGVVVGDDDLGPVDVVEHVARDQLAAGVVAVGVVRLEDAQAILDRQAGRDDEEAAGEVLAAGVGGRR